MVNYRIMDLEVATVLSDPAGVGTGGGVDRGVLGAGTGSVAPGDNTDQLDRSVSVLLHQGATTVTVAGTVGLAGGEGADVRVGQAAAAGQGCLAVGVADDVHVELVELVGQGARVVTSPAVEGAVAVAAELVGGQGDLGNGSAAITVQGVEVEGLRQEDQTDVIGSNATAIFLMDRLASAAGSTHLGLGVIRAAVGTGDHLKVGVGQAVGGGHDEIVLDQGAGTVVRTPGCLQGDNVGCLAGGSLMAIDDATLGESRPGDGIG